MKQRCLGAWGFAECASRPSPRLLDFLQRQVGQGSPLPEAELGKFRLPRAARLPKFGVSVDRSDWARVFYSVGQSFPDLVAIRTANQASFPEAVLFPTSSAEVQQILALASRENVAVIPRGGGTSVVGGVSLVSAAPPTVVLSLERLTGMVSLDGRSGLATFYAGTPGPELEAKLAANGFWLGHEPQSFALSTVGGWVATRSAGQRSTGVGKIEDLVAGLEVVLPSGTWRLLPQPASAMGPELRRLWCGSEGRLGVITQVTLRVRPVREQDPGMAYLVPSFSQGLEACRVLLQSNIAPEVLRLSDEGETAFALQMASLGRVASLGRDLLFRWRRSACLLLVGFGNLPQGHRQLSRHLRAYGGLPLGQTPWQLWQRDRFLHPYLRDAFLRGGFGVDTFETAAPWSALERLVSLVKTALTRVADGLHQRVLVLCHLSHAYRDGACLYFTFFWPLHLGDVLEHWQQYKEASVEAILAAGGTISHHHGVGRMHAPWWPREVGQEGVMALKALVSAVDPQGILNPGVILP